MKYSICLYTVLFFSFSLSVHAQQRFSVVGRIIENNLDGAPIPFAHVYLNGTSFGTQADVNGRFVLKGIPQGIYKFSISMVGFKTSMKLTSIDSDLKNMVERLDENVMDLMEVRVKGQKDKVWNKSIRDFENEFLGRDISRSEIQILNREVIDVDYDQQKKVLTAKAEQPLMIENRNLGYLYRGFLVEFQKGINRMSFKVSGYFEPLKASSAKQEARWEANRKEVFQGSINHFLWALCRNILVEEGFYAYYYKDRKYMGLVPEFKVNQVLKPTSDSTIFLLELKGMLAIDHHDNFRRNSKIMPVSQIFFNQYGELIDPYSLELYGKMSENRMGKELPSDYIYHPKD
jgi:hypothetical protein